MRKKVAFICFLVAAGLFISTVHWETTEASTNITGLITIDSIWTKAQSPYILTGPVGIIGTASVTVEPGVTINLNNFTIQVNGTLIARGSSEQKIQVDTGKIVFMPYKAAQTSEESVIEKCNLNVAIETSAPSLKIIDNFITAKITVNETCLISNNIIMGDISVIKGSPVISNNTLTGQVKTYLGKAAGYAPLISNNVITCGGIVCYGGNGYGGYANISNNFISGCQTAILGGDSVIERNLILNNTVGIEIENGIMNENTITNNSIGINIPKQTIYFSGFGELPLNPKILNNNIYGNTNASIYSTVSNNVNATYNWWGTTDTQAIREKIHDQRSDYNLGEVTFLPLLTSPNKEAPTNSIPDFPTPTTSNQPSDIPIVSLGWDSLLIASLLLAVVVLLVFVVVFLRRRSTVVAAPQ